MVSFTDKPVQLDGSIYIKVRTDLILMDISSREIYVVDRYVHTHIMGWCAKDSDSFLDALIIAQRYLKVGADTMML